MTEATTLSPAGRKLTGHLLLGIGSEDLDFAGGRLVKQAGASIGGTIFQS
jgi:hypothetical protein